MSTQLKAALYRFVAIFIAVGGGNALLQWLTAGTYDWRQLGIVILGDLVLAGEQYIKSGALISALGLDPSQVGTSNPIAPPQAPVVTDPPPLTAVR